MFLSVFKVSHFMANKEFQTNKPVTIPNLADKLDDVQMHNILSILNIDGINDIPGFNSNELKSMINCVSTNRNNYI